GFRDRARTEGLKRVLCVPQIILRRAALRIQDVGLSRETAGAKLRGSYEELLHPDVEEVGGLPLVRAGERERQEVAVLLHGDVQPLDQRDANRPRLNHGEVYRLISLQRRDGGDPGEANGFADRVAQPAVLEDSLLGLGERIRTLGRIGPQRVVARNRALSRLDSSQSNRIAPGLSLDPETLVGNHLVDDREAADQLDPGAVGQELGWPVGAAIVGTDVSDPEGAASLENGFDEAGCDYSRGGAKRRENYDETAETFDCRPVATEFRAPSTGLLVLSDRLGGEIEWSYVSRTRESWCRIPERARGHN